MTEKIVAGLRAMVETMMARRQTLLSQVRWLETDAEPVLVVAVPVAALADVDVQECVADLAYFGPELGVFVQFTGDVTTLRDDYLLRYHERTRIPAGATLMVLDGKAESGT